MTTWLGWSNSQIKVGSLTNSLQPIEHHRWVMMIDYLGASLPPFFLPRDYRAPVNAPADKAGVRGAAPKRQHQNSVPHGMGGSPSPDPLIHQKRKTIIIYTYKNTGVRGRAPLGVGSAMKPRGVGAGGICRQQRGAGPRTPNRATHPSWLHGAGWGAPLWGDERGERGVRAA